MSRSQKLKQLRVGPFTVTKQTTIATYEIQEDAIPKNIKVTHRNHLIEKFPHEERLPPLITNFAPITEDSVFCDHLVLSQSENYNSDQQKCSLDVMAFILSPLRDIIEKFQQNQKNHATFPPNADSGIQSPATYTNDDHNYQTLTISPLPPQQNSYTFFDSYAYSCS